MEMIKAEILQLQPYIYKEAMLLRFGLMDGVTHSRTEVSRKYSIDADTLKTLEEEIFAKSLRPTGKSE